MKLTKEQREALEDAITQLDAQWEFDAQRGMRDGWGGSEYRNQSPVLVLQAILDHDTELRV